MSVDETLTNATCAKCGLKVTAPYDEVWSGRRPWTYDLAHGHLCPDCRWKLIEEHLREMA